MERADPLAEVARLAPDGDRLAACLAGPFRRAIRAHPRRGAPRGWGELAPVPWHAGGFFHGDAIDPATRLDYHTGCAYPQDAASQLPVALLDPRPGETIVDACAAPGSKSTQIGIALGDDGLLLCCDASAPRRRVLAENLARQGVACALVTPMPVDALGQRAPRSADGVLVDAPCSGHEARSAKQVARLTERVQLPLLTLAAALVRPGGRLVYSTCTPYREEDEGVVERFLARHRGWRIDDCARAGCDAALGLPGALRLWPQRQATEPFFACRLRAPDDGEAGDGLDGRPEVDDGFARRWLPESTLTSWRRGELRFVGSARVAACALPSEARGLIVARGERLEPWGAQALIERGARSEAVTHARACALWGGDAADLADDALLRTDADAPLGVVRGGRLDLPSRLRRADLL